MDATVGQLDQCVAEEVISEAHPPITALQRAQQPPYSAHPKKTVAARAQRFLCRIDVCWTLLVFVFLVCVGVLTTSITQTKITAALVDDLRNIHDIRLAILARRFDQKTEVAFNMASGLLALHSEEPFVMRSEATLARVCTMLATYDISTSFRYIGVGSMDQNEAIVCMHGDRILGREVLYGLVTENSVSPGRYVVSNDTFLFQRPLQPVYGGIPPPSSNITAALFAVYRNLPIFKQAVQYFDGIIPSVDRRNMWIFRTGAPHLISCLIPAGMLFRQLNISSTINITDFVEIRIDGTSIAIPTDPSVTKNVLIAVFVNATLVDADPSVMSNNWGQQSVNDSEILAPPPGMQLEYLKVSGISHPLMRAALRHINLALLQHEGYTKTVTFQYGGAPAVVTASTAATAGGLILPAVLVSAHVDVSTPYRRLMDISNGINAVVIVIFTALFWSFAHTQFHAPLQRITHRMRRNLRTGHRAFTREPAFQLFQLTETRELLQAHQNTVRQLREIDAFIPKDIQEQIARGVYSSGRGSTQSAAALPPKTAAPSVEATPSALIDQLSTLVCITVRSCDVVPVPLGHAPPVPPATAHRRAGQHLVEVVEHAARAAELVNSGPFPTPAALEGFVAALHRCCDECDGTVLRLAPDSCVVHFGKAVRAHLARRRKAAAAAGRAGAERGEAAAAEEEDADTDVCAAHDARCALRFAFALLRWVDHCDAPRMPDVRVLVDTAVFACGQYRPRGSEQTLSVALGRDVQRKLGHVPASIGVRVAMTEETATYVRAGHVAGSVGGVRQIPVEAFHVGRVGLNADVIILFEALPGAVAEGVGPWQRYAECCFDGFRLMVHGHYADALCVFRNVADITDLEPGLMPRSLSREAARSDVRGTAVSTQVERLMRECVRRTVKGDTRPFLRERYVPLGIDATLGRLLPRGVVPETVGERPRPAATANSTLLPASKAFAVARSLQAYPRVQDRRVVVMQDGAETIRTVVSVAPQWIQDNNGLIWYIASRPIDYNQHAFWRTRFTCLGAAGSIAIVNFLAFRDVPPVVANAIKDAPEGVMSDALRSAVPLVSATPQQEADVHALFVRQQRLQHPNLLVPLGYSTSVESGVAFLWEYDAGGTLRQTVERYAHIKPATLARFTRDILTGLAYLHKRGLAHGALHMDNAVVNADGACRLHGHSADAALRRRVFVCPRTRYVSPLMASGAAATPACDIFCYGLLCLDFVSSGRVWKWAPARDGQQPPRSEQELEALMAEAGQPFYDLVAGGLVEPRTDRLVELAAHDAFLRDGLPTVLRALSLNARERPSAADVLAVKERMAAKLFN